MAGVAFPPGILSRAVPHVSALIDITPAPPNPLPIPFPNTAAHFEYQPALPVLDALFELDIGVLGTAPQTDSFAV